MMGVGASDGNRTHDLRHTSPRSNQQATPAIHEVTKKWCTGTTGTGQELARKNENMPGLFYSRQLDQASSKQQMDAPTYYWAHSPTKVDPQLFQRSVNISSRLQKQNRA